MTDTILAAIALALVLGLTVRCTVFSGNRIRRMRWRVKLWMRPGQGFASHAEVACRWSRLAALGHGRRARPSMKLRHRLVSRTTRYAVRLGRTQWFRRAFARGEDQTIILSMPRVGKALALDTPVPTPAGWTTMGEIAEGDVVFGSDGRPVRVTDAWPVRRGRPCFEVGFSDGSVIVADADHQWLVDTRSSRLAAGTQRTHPGSRGWPGRQKFPEVLTTAEMARNVRVGSDNRVNYSVGNALALQLPDADLPVPPYTLGAWLGDGTSKSGCITNLDPEVIAAIEAEGEICKRDTSPSGLRKACPSYRVMGLQQRLRALGVLRNKRIPIGYLRSSEQQRRALLAGLLDTDGSCRKNGTVEFYSTREPLAGDVRRLAASLGYKSSSASKPARLYGKDCGSVWTVTISAGADVLFRVSRKAARQSRAGQGRAAARVRHRYVTSIRPVPSVPVRCIAVAAADRMFLAGEACIPTHNSGLLADRVIEHPGPALVAESRSDMYALTAGHRSRLGPIEVFNPRNVSGIPSTFRWNITAGCADPTEALLRADGLIGDVATGDMQWWSEKSAAALAAAMHAADLIGGDMRDVWAWSNNLAYHLIDQARQVPGASLELFGCLAELDRQSRSADSIRLTMSKALAWMAAPEIRAMVTGPEAKPFDVASFAASNGTIYMMASGTDSPSAPLFRCFTSYVHRAAGHYGLALPHRKLDPGLLIAIDELHACPVDLPSWLADSAGKGIQVVAVVHSTGQLRDKYGQFGYETVWSTAGTKLFLPGIHDPQTLEDVSKLCGTIRTDDGKEPVCPPELLRMLPDWTCLVIRSNLHPLVVRFRPAWRRLDHRFGRRPLPDLRPAPALRPSLLRVLDTMPETAGEPELIGSVNGHGKSAAAPEDAR